jgi:hypothetical protein
MFKAQWAARLGALCYIAWGLFHVNVAHDIYVLAFAQTGITQGRLYQLDLSPREINYVDVQICFQCGNCHCRRTSL